MANNKKQFAPEVGFWPTKNGSGYSCQVTEKVLNELSKAELGGRLFIQEVPAERREKNEKAPHYRVIIFPPSEQPRREQDNDAV